LLLLPWGLQAAVQGPVQLLLLLLLVALLLLT
jgi:hypothetical protein